jgi:uncharacterized phiE125 gp8 family phage protein
MSFPFDVYFGAPGTKYCYPRIDYVLQTGPAALPVTVDEVKQQARIDPSITSEDTYLTLLINAAVTAAENYMRRDLINKTYYAFMDYFPSYLNAFPNYPYVGIELTRSKLQSITAIEYLVSGVFQTFSSANYYFTNDTDFSSIYLVQGQSYPENVDTRKQAVRITFVAGYGATSSNVPIEIKLALLNHITFMYQQRGDSGDAGFSASIPELALDIYDQFKIYSLGTRQTL